MYSLQIRGGKTGWNGKKKKKDIKSCIKIELCKKTKNTFIFTTVITRYIISVFLWVGSWGHIEKENKGKKKENSKTTGLQKNSEERYYAVKEKKMLYKKLKSVTFDFKNMKQGDAKCI